MRSHICYSLFIAFGFFGAVVEADVGLLDESALVCFRRWLVGWEWVMVVRSCYLSSIPFSRTGRPEPDTDSFSNLFISCSCNEFGVWFWNFSASSIPEISAP